VLIKNIKQDRSNGKLINEVNRKRGY
jgi:hypothetical protein